MFVRELEYLPTPPARPAQQQTQQHAGGGGVGGVLTGTRNYLETEKVKSSQATFLGGFIYFSSCLLNHFMPFGGHREGPPPG